MGLRFIGDNPIKHNTPALPFKPVTVHCTVIQSSAKLNDFLAAMGLNEHSDQITWRVAPKRVRPLNTNVIYLPTVVFNAV